MPRVYNRKDKNIPEDAIFCGRPSKYGNPGTIGALTRDQACDGYEEYVEARPELKAEFSRELKGRDLICFCAPLCCHCGYLLRITNA